MADGCRMIERWTLRSLVGAFLDLAVAYIFLSAAAVAFAAAKFFSFFGVDLSCQHYLPFALRPTPAPFIAVCPRPPWEAPSVRSPRRPVILFHNNNNNNNNNNNWAEFSESEWESESEWAPVRLGRRSSVETAVPPSYAGQLVNSSLVDNEGEICDGLENDENDGAFAKQNCDLTIEKLKRAVEEERAARAALSRELEKERSAAASAADEAMAMMLRLQEEKAAVEIEARQYRRMFEEKSAFDEEQVVTLQQIILRRDRENYVLQMELEKCQQQMMIMMMNNNNGTNLHSFDQHKEKEEEEVAGIGGRVYDVHVIDDDNMSLCRDQNAEHQKPSQTESAADTEKLLLGRREKLSFIEEINKSTEAGEAVLPTRKIS